MRQRDQSLVKSAGWLTAGNFIYLLSQLAVLTALARYTDLTTVGNFGFVMAISVPIFTLSGLGLRMGQTTDVAEEYTFSDYFGLRILMTIAGLIIILAIISIWKPEVLVFSLLIVAAKVVEKCSDLFYGSMQRFEKVVHVSVSLMLRGPLTVAVFVLLLAAGYGANIAFFAQLVVWSAVALFHDFGIVRRLETVTSPRFHLQTILTLLCRTIPLGAGLGLNALQVSVPRLIVNQVMGTEALGLFTVAGYFQQAASTLINSVGHAISARLARLWNDGKKTAYWRIVKRMALWGGIVSAFGLGFAALAGDVFLATVFGREYGAAAVLFLLIAIAISFRLMAAGFQFVLFSQRRFMAFGALQPLILAVTVLAAYTGVIRAGLSGLGLGIALAALFRLLVLVFVALRGQQGRRECVNCTAG